MGLVVTPLPARRRFSESTSTPGRFQNLGGRELVWRFDGGDITSDGGAILLQKTERRTGIIRRFAACFQDYRNPQRIEHGTCVPHPLLDLIAQRVYGLALGYEDLNDHDELRTDPMLAIALDKDDPTGKERRRALDRGKSKIRSGALAGKSTLNRLELTAPDYEGSPRQPGSRKPETRKIAVDPESIDALFVDLFLEAHAQAPEQIILDIDATDDPLHGNQEGRFYHGYYGDYCYPEGSYGSSTAALRVLRRALAVRPAENAERTFRVEYRCLGGFGGGTGAGDGAHSPEVAGGADPAARGRGLLPGELDGLVREGRYRLCLWLGAERAAEEADCRPKGRNR